MEAGAKIAIVALIIIILITLFVSLSMPVRLGIIDSSSMYPELKPFDMVVGLSTRYFGYPTYGDIAVYERNGTLIAHQVVGFNGTYYIFKGINNPAPDPPVPKASVLYTVVAVIPAELWLTALSLAAGAATVVLTLRSGVRTSSLFAPFLVALLLLLLAVVLMTAPSPDIEFAKPVRLPVVEAINATPSEVVVAFNGLTGISNVSCFAVMRNGTMSPVQCLIDNSTVVILPGSPAYDSFRIDMTTEYYNMTLIYEVGVG